MSVEQQQNINTKKKKKILSNIFTAAVILSAIVIMVWFCFTSSDLDELAEVFFTLNMWWIAAAVCCMVLRWVFESLVLYFLGKDANNEYRFKDAFFTTMAGQYFNAITPFSSGGQPFQFYQLKRSGIDGAIATAVLLQKFFIYQSALTAYSLILIILRFKFFMTEVSNFALLALVGFSIQLVAIIISWIFMRSERLTGAVVRGITVLLSKLHIVKRREAILAKLNEKVESFSSCNRIMHKNKRLFVKCYLATFVQETVFFLVVFFVVLAFGGECTDVITLIAAQCFVSVATFFFPLPGAAGASEGGFLLFAYKFFTPAARVPATLLWRIITYYISIIAGAPFAVLWKGSKDFSKQEQTDESKTE